MGKKVRLAIEDPNNPETKATIEAIKEKGFEVNLSLASHSGIDDALKIYDQTQKYKKIEIQESVDYITHREAGDACAREVMDMLRYAQNIPVTLYEFE